MEMFSSDICGATALIHMLSPALYFSKFVYPRIRIHAHAPAGARLSCLLRAYFVMLLHAWLVDAVARIVSTVIYFAAHYQTFVFIPRSLWVTAS